MANAMMLERTGMGMPGMGVSGVSPGVAAASASGSSSSWLMVPRCTLRFEKCSGGMQVLCSCDDKLACSMMQNLCTMLTGGMCSCSAMFNGMVVCCYNFTMGMCKCEMTDSGVCVTCTSGDKQCCDMIQAACDCLTCLANAGCTCCVLMNNNPICCGYSEAYAASCKATTKR
jgi:hypothetical protein